MGKRDFVFAVIASQFLIPVWSLDLTGGGDKRAMNALPTETLFDEIWDFLASTLTLAMIVVYKPSGRLEARLAALLERNSNAAPSQEEQAELDALLQMDSFFSLRKAKVCQKLAVE